MVALCNEALRRFLLPPFMLAHFPTTFFANLYLQSPQDRSVGVLLLWADRRLRDQ